MFPKITHIDQVRAAIKDRPEFIEAEREHYIVFNYLVAHDDSFDCPIRRECRGLIFDKNGNVISRRFAKFFNAGEKEFTQMKNLPWDQPHVVLHKLDGSMITPLWIGEGLFWATKMGITDIGEQARLFAEYNPKYIEFVTALDRNYTPIFEYMGPGNRVVIGYPEEQMVLLAIRNNVTGRYMSYESLKFVAEEFDIPLVQEYHGSLDDLKNEVGIEGVVVRFEDGTMVKMKTEWYVAIHKAKENLLHEKNVIRLILEEKDDDVIANLPDEDADKMRKFKEALIKNVESIIDILEIEISALIRDQVSRKEFALAPNYTAFCRSIVFSCWENPGKVREAVIKYLLSRCGSQTDVDSIRDIIRVHWNPTQMES